MTVKIAHSAKLKRSLYCHKVAYAIYVQIQSINHHSWKEMHVSFDENYEFQAHHQPVPAETSKPWCGVGLRFWRSSQCFLSSSGHPSFPAAFFHQPWVNIVCHKSVWCHLPIRSVVDFRYDITAESGTMFAFIFFIFFLVLWALC